MSHNTFKIAKYDLTKKSPSELKHYIQLINIDIENYQRVIQNYPPIRMNRYGKPHLQRLQSVLDDVTLELQSRGEEQ